MGRKRKHQGDPDPIIKEKKKQSKEMPRRKRRKLAHAEEQAESRSRNRQVQARDQPAASWAEEEAPYQIHEDEIDVPTTGATFLQQLDPSQLSIVPPKSQRKERSRKSGGDDQEAEYERSARSWSGVAEEDGEGTASAPTQKPARSPAKSSQPSAQLLKAAQQRVKERVRQRDQGPPVDEEGNEKKISAAKMKRKEEARFTGQLKEISSTEIDMSQVPDLLRLGWINAQESPVELQFYLQQVKEYIASLAGAVIEDPQKNCKILIDLEIACKYYPKNKHFTNEPEEMRPNQATSKLFVTTRKLAILSLVAVLNDITPGYRVRGDNEDLRTQSLKKSVREVRTFEYAVLSSYNRFLNFVEHQLQQKKLIEVCVHGLCQLLDHNYHFNCRTRLLQMIVPFMNAEEEALARKCVVTVENLFEKDELGEASQEAVRFIMQYVKTRSYNVRPEIIDSFLKLRFTQDLSQSLRGGLSGTSISKKQYQHLSGNKKKKHREEKALERDMQEATAEENKKLMTHFQAEILKSIFSLYFRVLKMEVRTTLLDPVLRGLAKYAHLINLDFQADLFKALRQLMNSDSASVQTVLQCAVTAFENLQMHGNTIEIDLKDFYERVYESIMEVPDEPECLGNLLHAVRLMISNNRHLDANRVAAFCKRLATICGYLPPNGVISVLVTIQRLMQTFPAIRQLLDATEEKSANRYNPLVHQPDTCNALATSLWELVLLETHYHPTISERSAACADGQGTQLIPLDTLKQFDTSLGGFNPPIPKPSAHPFEGVMKNDPKSKCYMSTVPAPSAWAQSMVEMSDDYDGDDAVLNNNLFGAYWDEEKQFDHQLEKEKLGQKLQVYRNLLQKYLEFGEQ